MRFAPKRVGEPYTLDDYNATIYLLTQDEWCEDTFSLSYTNVEGEFAGYSLSDPQQILYTRREHYVISDLIGKNSITTNKYSTIYIVITDPVLTEAEYSLEIEYKLPVESVSGGGTTSAADSIDENLEDEDLTNFETDYQTLVLDMDLYKEQTVYYDSLEKSYYTETPPDSSRFTTQYRKTYSIVLPKVLEQDTIIKNTAKMHINIHPRAEIDPWNGKTNEPDEIIIYPDRDCEYGYTWDTLSAMIEKVPTNGNKHIFRLIHEGHRVYIKNQIEIRDGQNIELRGGTNYMAMMDGTYCERAFYVHSGGTLTLKHIHFKEWHYLQDGENNLAASGYGGVILVDYTDLRGDTAKWGTLICESCDFENCYAYYGGAIYSYHARIDIRYCNFISCSSWNNSSITNYGGAIFYDSLRGNDLI